MGRGFDVIVVGSGFGGAVTACRLAEAGASVLVLERGRRWTKAEYPRQPDDAWLFDHGRPEKHNGWLDLRFFKRMAVAQGAGVGGGSLCYSSVVMEADAERFAQGWPPEITRAELEPYYSQVRTMLAVRPIPPGQHTGRYKLMQEAARLGGLAGRFSSVPLALSFDPEWNYNLPDPLSETHSKSFINAQGQQQGTCVHLGNCDIGCEVLREEYTRPELHPRAEQCGAEVRPLHVVRSIRPDGTGYRVMFDRIERGHLIPARSAEGVSFWPRAHSAQPSSCCGVETSTKPCPTSAAYSARAGVQMPMSSLRTSTRQARKSSSRSDQRSPVAWTSWTAWLAGPGTTSRMTAFPT